jgi:hypothetical protein
MVRHYNSELLNFTVLNWEKKKPFWTFINVLFSKTDGRFG